jgi:hypothetical protein
LWTNRARLLAAVDGASGATEDGWTPAEHLAHVVAWQRRLLTWFEDDRAGRTVVRPEPGWTFDDTDAMNEHYHRLTQGIALADARAAFEAAHAQVEVLVRRLSDVDLNDPARFPWLGYPAADNIAGNSFGHYREHAEWLGG